MQRIAFLEHERDGVVRDIVAGVHADGLVQGWVERLSFGFDFFHALAGKHGGDLVADHADAIDKAFVLRRGRRGVDGPGEIIHHRQQLAQNAFASPLGIFFLLAQHAFAEILEFRPGAEIAFAGRIAFGFKPGDSLVDSMVDRLSASPSLGSGAALIKRSAQAQNDAAPAARVRAGRGRNRLLHAQTFPIEQVEQGVAAGRAAHFANMIRANAFSSVFGAPRALSRPKTASRANALGAARRTRPRRDAFLPAKHALARQRESNRFFACDLFCHFGGSKVDFPLAIL